MRHYSAKEIEKILLADGWDQILTPLCSSKEVSIK